MVLWTFMVLWEKQTFFLFFYVKNLLIEVESNETFNPSLFLYIAWKFN